jgi:hypothetical protein
MASNPMVSLMTYLSRSFIIRPKVYAADVIKKNPVDELTDIFVVFVTI